MFEPDGINVVIKILMKFTGQGTGEDVSAHSDLFCNLL